MAYHWSGFYCVELLDCRSIISQILDHDLLKFPELLPPYTDSIRTMNGGEDSQFLVVSMRNSCYMPPEFHLYPYALISWPVAPTNSITAQIK